MFESAIRPWLDSDAVHAVSFGGYTAHLRIEQIGWGAAMMLAVPVTIFLAWGADA